jgi:hypothetical protein
VNAPTRLAQAVELARVASRRRLRGSLQGSALLLLAGCNAILGIDRHDHSASAISGGAAGTLQSAETGGSSGFAGTAAAGAIGGADGVAGMAGMAGDESGPREDDLFVALWSFEAMEGAQVFPTNGSPFPLNVQSATLSEGATGKHLVLSSSQSSAVASGPVVDASGSFSISVWIRLDLLDRWNSIVAQDGQAISPFYLQKRDTNLFAFTTFPADDTRATPCIAEGALQPKASEWYHLVATRDAESGEQRIYVDGVLSGKAVCAGGFSTTGPLVVGRGKWGVPADWTNGAVDELGVADRVLSPEEIIDLYRLGRPDARHYLFGYFAERADGRGDGLHFAYSHDALVWSAIGAAKTFLSPTVGGLSFRDPHILCDANGIYHVVWTSSCVPWAEPGCIQDRGFGHATSKDLVTFTDSTFIEIPRDKLDVEHFWAPETFHDAASGQYVLTWASPLDLTPAADPHSIYYMLTQDFMAFSDPAVLYGRAGRDLIDATIIQQADSYLMFVKDEAEGQKNLRVVRSPALFGISAWTDELSDPLTGAFAAEGPFPLQKDGAVLLYFDKYGEGATGALRSRDLLELTDPGSWEDVTVAVSGAALRHGSIVEVPFDVLRAVALRAAR